MITSHSSHKQSTFKLAIIYNTARSPVMVGDMDHEERRLVIARAAMRKPYYSWRLD